MSVGTVCSRETIICRSDESLAAAAQLMVQSHVGSIVVVDDRGGSVVPIAMLTDRDIVRGLTRERASLESLTVREVATPHPLIAVESDDVGTVIEAMLGRAVRRVPVVNASGALVGILSVDDLVGYFSDQLRNLAQLVATQVHRERG